MRVASVRSRRSPALPIACLALVVACTGITPADAVNAVKRAAYANNAGAVSNIKASTRPRPNRLLALDRSGKFPASVVPQAPRGPRGAEGPRGLTGSAGPIGPRGPSEALITMPPTTSLSRVDGTYVEVASLPILPAGAYLAFFNADVSYRVNGHRIIAICQIRVDGVAVGSTSGLVGDATGGTGVLSIGTTAPVNSATPLNLTASCRPSENALDGQPSPEIRSVRMAAIRLDSVTVG